MNYAVETAPRAGVALSFGPCWFEAPPERTPLFFPTYTRVSMALQAELRSALPLAYLADLERFRNTRTIYPLLVYASSRPFPGQPRIDFTYDVLNPALMRRFYFSVRHNLPRILNEVSARLRANGMSDVARHYRPDRSRELIATVDRLKMCRRRLESLLVAETWMINDLIGFAGSGALAPRVRTRIAAKIGKQWLSRLRCLWAGQDFTFLGPQLVSAVTGALCDSLVLQNTAGDESAAAAGHVGPRSLPYETRGGSGSLSPALCEAP